MSAEQAAIERAEMRNSLWMLSVLQRLLIPLNRDIYPVETKVSNETMTPKQIKILVDAVDEAGFVTSVRMLSQGSTVNQPRNLKLSIVATTKVANRTAEDSEELVLKGIDLDSRGEITPSSTMPWLQKLDEDSSTKSCEVLYSPNPWLPYFSRLKATLSNEATTDLTVTLVMRRYVLSKTFMQKVLEEKLFQDDAKVNADTKARSMMDSLLGA